MSATAKDVEALTFDDVAALMHLAAMLRSGSFIGRPRRDDVAARLEAVAAKISSFDLCARVRELEARGQRLAADVNYLLRGATSSPEARARMEADARAALTRTPEAANG